MRFAAFGGSGSGTLCEIGAKMYGFFESCVTDPDGNRVEITE